MIINRKNIKMKRIIFSFLLICSSFFYYNCYKKSSSFLQSINKNGNVKLAASIRQVPAVSKEKVIYEPVLLKNHKVGGTTIRLLLAAHYKEVLQNNEICKTFSAANSTSLSKDQYNFYCDKLKDRYLHDTRWIYMKEGLNGFQRRIINNTMGTTKLNHDNGTNDTTNITTVKAKRRSTITAKRREDATKFAMMNNNDNNNNNNNQEKRELKLISIFRDPLEKALSWIFSKVGGLEYSFSSPQANLTCEIIEQNLTRMIFQGGLFEYTTTFSYPYAMSSLPKKQNNKLLKYMNYIHPYLGLGRLNPKYDYWSEINKDFVFNITEDHISQTKLNIEKELHVIALTGEMEKSIALLGMELGWTSVEDYCYHSRRWPDEHHEQRKAITDDVKNCLRKVLEPEYQIYDFVVKLFHQRIEKIENKDFYNQILNFLKSKKRCNRR